MSITKNDLKNVMKKYNAEIKSMLSSKVDKVTGKDLSTNDYTTAEKTKLAGIATGATNTVLNNTVTSTSTTQAATANAAKMAYDIGNHSHPYAASSHTHNYAGSSSAGGVANSAAKLQTARTIALSGQIQGSTTFDGSGNTTITTREGLATTNSGSYSHAEGFEAQSDGDYSHAEGSYTIARGEASHAEGGSTVAGGIYSHAEGYNTSAKGYCSHTEGNANISIGKGTHCEGVSSISISGSMRTAIRGNIDMTYRYLSDTSVLLIHENGVEYWDEYFSNLKIGTKAVLVYYVGSDYIPLEFIINSFISDGTNMEITFNLSAGYSNDTTIKIVPSYIIWDISEYIEEGSCASHAEGYRSTSIGEASHAEGSLTLAYGASSHAEGYSTESLAQASHAEGGSTIAGGFYSHSEGNGTIANADVSHAEGYYTTAETYLLHVQGRYNKVNSGSASSYSASQNAFVIGNGSSSYAKSNAFRVTYAGASYGLSAFNSTGADYAEYFEWEDGNPDNEDRVGKFVTLNGDKIRLATENDDYILGITSGNPAIIGNASDDSWNDMYMRDKYGRLIYEDVEVKAEYKTTPAITQNIIGENGEESIIEVSPEKTICIKEAVTEKCIKLNPDYNSELEYIPRSERKEWDTVGMLGQLIVDDDGTCIINGYCKCNNNNIATISDTGYRVINRIDEHTIIILFK